MMKNDFISSYKRQDPQADTAPVVSWKAAYGECRNSFYRFSFSHVVPPKHHAIFEIAPWRIRTGDHQFPGLDVFASVGGGANIRLWSIDKSGNPQLEAQVRCNTPASFRKLIIVPSPDSTKAVAVMYESTETGLLYGMPIEYQVKDGRETLICSSEEIRPIGFCPGKRPITRITVLETLVACADDIGQLFTFEVDPLRPHRMVTPKLAFPNLTIRCVLPMALLATHHLIETTNRDGIRIIDLETSKISTAFKQKNTADPGLATATAVSPSGDLVAVGSSTGVVEIFNIHTKDMIATLRLSDGAPLHQITFVTNSRLICAAYGGAVLVLSLRPDKHFKNMFQLSILRALNIGFEPAKLLLLGDTLLITVHRDSSIIVIKPAH
jgi:WD40 repeat protein